MSKDFGAQPANASASDRPASDFYPTPKEVTYALLDFLELPEHYTIWEPACGEGHMANAIADRGYKVIASDLYNRGFGEHGVDFLKPDHMPNGMEWYCMPDWIITNPPFNVSVGFIERALKLMKDDVQIKGAAFLLKSQYWHSSKRKALFDENPPSYVLPLTWRPDFLFGKKGGAPTMECLWTVWDAREGYYNETIYMPLAKPNA